MVENQTLIYRGLLNYQTLIIAVRAVEFELDMTERTTRLKVITTVLFASTLIIGCGSGPSPIESMKAPVLLVRQDSIHEVKDGSGQVYELNTIDRVDYATALLRLGDELTLGEKVE